MIGVALSKFEADVRLSIAPGIKLMSLTRPRRGEHDRDLPQGAPAIR